MTTNHVPAPHGPPNGTSSAALQALTATLARIARLGGDYVLHIGAAGAGWIHARDLVEGGSAFERAMERLGASRSDPSAQRAIGSRFVQDYLRFLAPVVAAFTLERRVPDVGADNLAVQLDEAGWPASFALIKPRFASLATEPEASAAAIVVADGSGLAAWLNDLAIQDNVAILIETVRARLRTSATPLWGNVAEAFARSLLWHVQPVAPASEVVVRDTEALLDRQTAPGAMAPRLADQVRLVEVMEAGDEWTVAARRTCCLRWCLPGGSRCEDCPLQREPESPDVLRARLSEAIARGRALRTDPALLAWRRGRVN